MLNDDQAVNVTVAVLKLRRLRKAVLSPDLFGEPAWDLLLELFVADAQGVRLTGREVGRRCDIKPQVLSRWLIVLSAEDLIVGDGRGELDDEITLSASGMASLESIIGMISEEQHALGMNLKRRSPSTRP